jgi:adenylate cyclase
MQRRVEALGPAAGVELCLRIGFHFGPVVERDGDVFGDTVNLASRLCDLASKGQIITDRETATRLVGTCADDLRTLFCIPVKGKAQEVELVEVVWQAHRRRQNPHPEPGRCRGQRSRAADARTG